MKGCDDYVSWSRLLSRTMAKRAMGDTPEPGQVRLWTYQALAHGAEAIIYFRWRTALFGTEQYWHGILVVIC